NDVGLIDRDLGLRLDRRPRRVLRGVEVQAGGVDDRKLTPAPLRDPVEAIAGQAGLRVDNRLPPTEHAVEEGRFTDVRPADDGNDGSGHGSIRRSGRPPMRPTGPEWGYSGPRMRPTGPEWRHPRPGSVRRPPAVPGG